MPLDRAKEIAEVAHGSFGANDITTTDSISQPIIDYVDENEQLHYLLSHSSKGVRIFETNGEERTPDHNSGDWGKRYLLITEQRIIYLVGRKSGDKVEEFDYQNINTTESKCSFTHCRLNFTLANGREYKFATHNSDAEDAEEYIQECIYKRYNRLKNSVSDLPNVEMEVPEPTSFDKLWERKNQYDKLEEDVSLWESNIDTQEQLQERAEELSYLDIDIQSLSDFDSSEDARHRLQEIKQALNKSESIESNVEQVENLSDSHAQSELQEAREVIDTIEENLTQLNEDYAEIVNIDTIQELHQWATNRLVELDKKSLAEKLHTDISEARKELDQGANEAAKQRISSVKKEVQQESELDDNIRTELTHEIATVESQIRELESLQEIKQNAAAKLEEARSKLHSGEYEDAISISQSGLGICKEVDDSERDSQSQLLESIEEIRADLRTIQSEAEELSNLIQEAEEYREAASTAVASYSYETACDALGDFQQIICELKNYDSADIEVFENDAEVIQGKIERGQATKRVEELSEKAEWKISHGEEFLRDASFDKATKEFIDAKEKLREASHIAENHQLTHREETEKQGKQIERLIELVDDTDSLSDDIETAIEDQSFDTADKLLEELTDTIEELRAHPLLEDSLEELDIHINEFESDIGENLTNRRWNSHISSVDSSCDRAENCIEERKYTEAVEYLVEALETIDNAAMIDKQSSLGNGDIIFEKQRRIQDLLSKAKSESESRHSELVSKAEETVAEGIESRKTDDPAGAAQAFAEAKEYYDEALELADTHDLTEKWETKERHAMVSEYLEITEEDLEERRRETRQEMTAALNQAESAITEAEQFAEVDDRVSVRDSLSEVIQYLDTATQLLSVEGVTNEQQSKYNSLIERADTLRKELPDEPNKKSYRNQDLVESLQILSTKLGESPRQEFVNKFGEYPADAYLDAFGSWSEALAAANLQQIDEDVRSQRFYRRVEVLKELINVAEKLDEQPSKSQINEHGGISASTIEDRFQNWETALDLAGLIEDDGTSDSPPHQRSQKEKTKERDPEEMKQSDILNLLEQEVSKSL